MICPETMLATSSCKNFFRSHAELVSSLKHRCIGLSSMADTAATAATAATVTASASAAAPATAATPAAAAAPVAVAAAGAERSRFRDSELSGAG